MKSKLEKSKIYGQFESFNRVLRLGEFSQAYPGKMIIAGYPIKQVRSKSDTFLLLAAGHLEYQPGHYQSTSTSSYYVPTGAGGGHWSTRTTTIPEQHASVNVSRTKSYFAFRPLLPIQWHFILNGELNIGRDFYSFWAKTDTNYAVYKGKRVLVFQPLLRSDIPSDTLITKFKLPQLPPHLSDLKYPPVFVAQEKYLLSAPYATVPQELSVQINLRRTIKFYRKVISLFRSQILNQSYMPFAECVRMFNYFSAVSYTFNAEAYKSGKKTPFFIGIDDAYKIERARYSKSLLYLKKAIECDSVWDFPKREAAAVQSCLSGDSAMPQTTRPSRAIANRDWRIGVTARLTGLMPQETVEEIGNNIVRFSCGLSGAYFVTNDIAAELDWRPLEFGGSTSIGGHFSSFQWLRGDVGVRYQTPLRLQFWRLGTRLNLLSRFFLDKQSFKVEGYRYDIISGAPLALESEALAAGIEFGLGFTFRKSFKEKSWPYISVETGYKLGASASYKSRIGGQSSAAASAPNGGQIGYNPTTWYAAFSLLF